ncbi:MAG: hypothetical protein SFV51_02295, partial [Bryobacteraceae bacterium]|nr:hypothetical protein [Bryobacteraceae bacterium]
RCQPGTGCSRTPLALGCLSFSALDLGPKRRVGLFQRDGVPLEFTLGVREVLVDLGLMIQVEGDCTIYLGAFQRREVFLNGFRRLTSLNEYTTESNEMRVPAT